MLRILLALGLSISSFTASSEEKPPCLPWQAADAILKKNDYLAAFKGKPHDDESLDVWVYMRNDPSGMVIIYVNPKTLNACVGSELKGIQYHKENIETLFDFIIGKKI